MSDQPAGSALHLRLLESIAEQLKSPLTVIARQAELSLAGVQTHRDDFCDIRQHAAVALSLIDNYLLGLQLTGEQTALALEPLSAASALNDAAQELTGFARQNGVRLAVHIAGRYQPVVAHRRALRAALVSMGYELIAAQAAQNVPAEPGAGQSSHHPCLTLVAHRTARGIVAGMYGDYEALSETHWRTALELSGRARQPFAALTSGSAAGLFVANTLLQAMTARLRVGRYNRQYGMAVTLQPSRQLRLV